MCTVCPNPQTRTFPLCLMHFGAPCRLCFSIVVHAAQSPVMCVCTSGTSCCHPILPLSDLSVRNRCLFFTTGDTVCFRAYKMEMQMCQNCSAAPGRGVHFFCTPVDCHMCLYLMYILSPASLAHVSPVAVQVFALSYHSVDRLFEGDQEQQRPDGDV